MEGYPRLDEPAPAPPPRKQNTVLIVVLIVCVLGTLAFFAALALGFVQVISRASMRMGTGAQSHFALPFLGPDPWEPSVQNAGVWKTYVLKDYGITMELPFEPYAIPLDYTEADKEDMSGYFNYESENETRQFSFYGLAVIPTSHAKAEYSALGYEQMFTEDPLYLGARFKREPIRIGGKEAYYIRGSYTYDGTPYTAEALAFAHRGLQLVLNVTSRGAGSFRSDLERIGKSVRLSNPDLQDRALRRNAVAE